MAARTSADLAARRRPHPHARSRPPDRHRGRDARRHDRRRRLRRRGPRSVRRRAPRSIDGGGAGARARAHRHPHPPVLGSDGALGADLTGLLTLRRRAATRCGPSARACGDGAWVRGYALAYEAFPDGGIDGRLIEEAVGGGPALRQLLRLPHGPGQPRARSRAPASTGRGAFTEAAEVVVRRRRARPASCARAGAIGLVDGGGARRRRTRSACSAYPHDVRADERRRA